jgi:uncharacterized protein YigE (DUF2233 family)
LFTPPKTNNNFFLPLIAVNKSRRKVPPVLVVENANSCLKKSNGSNNLRMHQMVVACYDVAGQTSSIRMIQKQPTGQDHDHFSTLSSRRRRRKPAVTAEDLFADDQDEECNNIMATSV